MNFLRYFFLIIFALNFGNSFAMEDNKVAQEILDEKTLDETIKEIAILWSSLWLTKCKDSGADSAKAELEMKNSGNLKEFLIDIIDLMIQQKYQIQEVIKFILKYKEIILKHNSEYLKFERGCLETYKKNDIENLITFLILNEINFYIYCAQRGIFVIGFKNGNISYSKYDFGLSFRAYVSCEELTSLLKNCIYFAGLELDNIKKAAEESLKNIMPKGVIEIITHYAQSPINTNFDDPSKLFSQKLIQNFGNHSNPEAARVFRELDPNYQCIIS